MYTLFNSKGTIFGHDNDPFQLAFCEICEIYSSVSCCYTNPWLWAVDVTQSKISLKVFFMIFVLFSLTSLVWSAGVNLQWRNCIIRTIPHTVCYYQKHTVFTMMHSIPLLYLLCFFCVCLFVLENVNKRRNIHSLSCSLKGHLYPGLLCSDVHAP